jgi:hypothetical protein
MYSMHVTTASIEGKYWKCWDRPEGKCSESDPGTLSTIWSFLLLPKCNYGTIYLPHMLAHHSTSKCNQPIYTKWARQHLGKWRWDFGEASKFLESYSPKLVIIIACSLSFGYSAGSYLMLGYCGACKCCFFRKNSKDSSVSFSSTTWHMTS